MDGFLCGWYVYEGVLAGLMAASAGGRTWLGRSGMAAAVVAVYLLLAQRNVVATQPNTFLAANVAVLATGIAGLVFARRSDTRQIALLLTFSAAVPVVLSFVHIT